jgi:ABC-type amino acid transport system permease subunit
MLINLLIGLPGERPGGLALTLVYFVASGFIAVAAGLTYATICTAFPRRSLVLQAGTAVVRGIPVILLVFLLAQLLPLRVGAAALAGLILYSLSHVGELLRSFLTAYPQPLREQAMVTGLTSTREWLQLRVPRTIACSLPALITHWISLLKDTGALVVLSIGELTTVAKTLSESTASSRHWLTVLTAAGVLYLAATLLLLWLLHRLRKQTFLKGLVGDETPA